MSSAKIQRNKKSVGFEDGTKSGRESRSRSRNKSKDRRAKSVDIRSSSQKQAEPKKRDRSLVSLVRTGSRKSVSNLVKLFEVGRMYYMTEGRKSQIVFPDDRELEILIQPKLVTRDLLDIVSSHFKLKEKDYFGLAFQDETGHYNWLQLEKKILEHDLPRKQGTNLVLHFLVKFYVEGIIQLQDTATVELFYLNAKQAVFKGQIECDGETVFELAAHVLQATQGDFTDEATAKADLKRLPLITTSALKEHPSIPFCEDKVLHYYHKLAGTAKGLAIVNYMTIVERLPTYGIHYYEVKDKKDIPWWLGISNKGISVYDKNDKSIPRRTFVWKHLENLYYREKKFSIEVHDPKRVIHTLSSFNLYEDAVREPISEIDELSDAITDPSTQVSVSRRTFGPGNVNVHAWFGSTPQLTKCVWHMAVAQHQFYHDRKNSRANLKTVRSVSELASELSRSTTSLPGSIGSDISRSGSSASLPSLGASRFDLNFDPADTSKVQREMFTAMKERRQYLEKLLQERTQELKQLCIQEGELTGKLPPETPLTAGEEPPQIRRRLGTAFSLASRLVENKNEEEGRTAQLELEVELQKQITNAAHKLASDKSVSRFVRKQRRQSFIKAQGKLKEMEKKLNECRKMSGHVGVTTGNYDDSEVISPAQSPLVPRGPRSNFKQHEDRIDESPIHRSATAPQQLTSPEPREVPPAPSPTTHQGPTEMGYTPNSVYATRTQYRHQTYPTLNSRSHPAGISQGEYDKDRVGNRLETSHARHDGSQDSGFSSTNNMYHVASRRTSQYVSSNDVSTPPDSHYATLDSVFDDKLKFPSKHSSLDSNYRKTLQNYGSLERNLKKRNDRNVGRKYSDSDTHTPEIGNLTPSKFGSKRTSQSEYDLSTKGRDLVRDSDTGSSSRRNSPPPLPRRNSSRENMIELPVTHETRAAKQDRYKNVESSKNDVYSRTAVTEPSPIIQSPTRVYNNLRDEPSMDPTTGSSYNPRGYEGSQPHTPASYQGYSNKNTPYTEHSIPVKRMDSHSSQHSIPKPMPSKIVTSGKASPHVEMSKPFEMSDFYKYSEKLRRQRLVEQYHQQLMGQNSSRSSTPSQHSSEGGGGENSYSRSSHQPTPGTPTRGQYRTGNNASPYGSPVTSRHAIGTPYTSHSQSQNRDGGNGGLPGQRMNVTSSSYQTVQEHGLSTSTSRVQYTVKSGSGQVLYKAQHQTSKHTHYTPPAPMKCDAVRDAGKGHGGSGDNVSSNSRQGNVRHQRQYSSPEKSINSPGMGSSFHLSPPGSLSRAFSNEMLEWYDGEGVHQSATEV